MSQLTLGENVSIEAAAMLPESRAILFIGDAFKDRCIKLTPTGDDTPGEGRLQLRKNGSNRLFGRRRLQ